LGLVGLDDKPGRGRKPSISNAKVARVVTEATRPPQGKTRWSIRSMSPSRRRLAEHGSTHLVEKRFEAASRENLQTLE